MARYWTSEFTADRKYPRETIRGLPGIQVNIWIGDEIELTLRRRPSGMLLAKRKCDSVVEARTLAVKLSIELYEAEIEWLKGMDPTKPAKLSGKPIIKNTPGEI